jgi:hypothetical protein
MKVIRQLGAKGGSRCLLRLSQQEWKEIGDKSGWVEEVDRSNRVKPTDKVDPEPSPEPFLLNDLDELEVTVEKYGDRQFAVYANGELLCVTAYRKGANAVKIFLETLWRENEVLKEKIRAETANGKDAGLERTFDALAEDRKPTAG